MLSGGLMLKILRVVVTEPSDSCLAQFLVWLAQFATLEELSLLLVASHPVFPLNAVLSHAHTLRCLVLDSRTETIIRFTIADLKQITEMQKAIKPACHLRVLHLRR